MKGNRIVSCGYNALPEHLHGPLEDENGNTKPEVRHSEKSALMGLVRSSENAVGATMFCTHSCCYFCAVDIVDAGIEEFIFRRFYRSDEGLIHLLKAGVKVRMAYSDDQFLELRLDDFVREAECNTCCEQDRKSRKSINETQERKIESETSPR